MLLSEIEFASFLAYSPRGESEDAAQSRHWVRKLKGELLVGGTPRESASSFVVGRLKARLDEVPFADWFGPDVLLVPAPSSALLQVHSLWVPNRIARALVRQGLGQDVLPCLERVQPVRKSATAGTANRPLARFHYDSMTISALDFPHDDVVVIDDVVTRGATLLVAVSLVQEALPGARVRGFAVVRTQSDSDDFLSMFAPVVGTISLRSDGQTTRRP